MWNTSPPRNEELWEEICYEYTKHNVERYGIETVSRWHCQYFNEPDISIFFLSQLPRDAVEARLSEYCKLYDAFQRGVRRVSEKIRIGGPALAHRHEFLGGFLDFVKEKQLKLDSISVHNYGTSPEMLNDNTRPYSTESILKKQEAYFETVRAHGFGDIPMIVDEWGMATAGFIDQCTTNPYRLYQKKSMDLPTEKDLKLLREEGNLKPVKLPKGTDRLHLRLTSNAVYLITVTE